MRGITKIKTLLKARFAGNFLFVDAGAKDELEYLKEFEALTEIHAFEPNPEEYNKLSTKYAQNSFLDLKLNQTGLAETEGSANLYITNRASMSSLLPADILNYKKHFGEYKDYGLWEQGIGLNKKTEVKVQSLDNYFKGKDPFIDFLKIDTQGTELVILKGAEGLIKNKRIGIIKLEVSTIPVYKDQVLFSEIDSYLRSHHYTLVDFITYRENYSPLFKEQNVKPHYGACGDAIYLLNADNESKSQCLRKSVILLWLGYSSLAVHMMQTLDLLPDEMNTLLNLSQPTLKKRLKNILKNILPPVVSNLIRKLFR